MPAVLAGNVVPWGRRGRPLKVPWAGPTTVETLAATLLAVAAAECRSLGLLTMDRSRRRMRLRAVIPEDRQPVGVAQVVLGCHQVGLRQRGWQATGTWKSVTVSWRLSGSVDPHWDVVELALGDLRAAGLLVVEADGVEQVDVEGLKATASRFLAGADAVDVTSPELVRAARQADRALRSRRITEAAGSDLGLSLGQFFTMSRESDLRQGRRLPPPSTGGPGGTRVGDGDPGTA